MFDPLFPTHTLLRRFWPTATFIVHLLNGLQTCRTHSPRLRFLVWSFARYLIYPINSTEVHYDLGWLKPAEFLIRTQGEIGPGNRAHVERPLDNVDQSDCRTITIHFEKVGFGPISSS